MSTPVQDGETASAEYRQGDVLPAVMSLPVTGLTEDNESAAVATTNGVVLLSQTCDVVQADRPTVQVAPLVELLEQQTAAEARGGRRPRYVHVPNAGINFFADLAYIATLHKSFLVTQNRYPGVMTDEDEGDLAVRSRAVLEGSHSPTRLRHGSGHSNSC